MALLGKGVFLTDPIGYLFGDNNAAPQNTTPHSTGSNYAIAEPIKTTTVIGYLLLAGVSIYLARKVLV